MCDFVSWIRDGKKIWFLTDKDCKKLMRRKPHLGWNDVIGHAAIIDVFPEAAGVEEEGIECIPPIIAKAIRAGKMDQMMTMGEGYEKLTYDAQGRLHNTRGVALVDSCGRSYYFLHGKEYNTEADWKKAIARAKAARARSKAKASTKTKVSKSKK